MKIFGAVGRIGSGKDEVIEYLSDKCGLPTISIGDLVRETAEQKGLEPTRENLRRVSTEEKQKRGETVFVETVLERVRSRQWEKAGITGIRTPGDVRFLKNRLGDEMTLFHVQVGDPHIRYERISRRDRPGAPKSYEDFLEQDQKEERMFHISDAAAMADHHLDNSGSLDDLHRQIDAALAGSCKPRSSNEMGRNVPRGRLYI